MFVKPHHREGHTFQVVTEMNMGQQGLNTIGETATFDSCWNFSLACVTLADKLFSIWHKKQRNMHQRGKNISKMLSVLI